MFISNRITVRIPCDLPAMRLGLMKISLGPCSSKHRDYEEPKGTLLDSFPLTRAFHDERRGRPCLFVAPCEPAPSVDLLSRRIL